jgi:FkbM family methyltransferase
MSKIWLIILLCQNWLGILLNKIFNWPLKLIRLRKGTVFLVKNHLATAELSILVDVWQKRVYNPQGFEINEHDVVVDVGAHKGYFSVLAARSASKGNVYAIEPVVESTEFIRANVALNDLHNIHVCNFGLWNQNGEVELFLSSNSGGHSLRPKPSTIGKRLIPIVTLEKFCDDRGIRTIDFLKLDCEGAEYGIFPLPKRILDRIQKLSMETHDFGLYHHSEIEKYLREGGFVVILAPGYLYARRVN